MFGQIDNDHCFRELIPFIVSFLFRFCFLFLKFHIVSIKNTSKREN